MLRLNQNDTDPIPLSATGEGGAPANLSGLTARLIARRTLSSPVVPLTLEVVDAAVGAFHWMRQPNELDAGVWMLQLKAGDKMTFPTPAPGIVGDDYLMVEIVPDLEVP